MISIVLAFFAGAIVGVFVMSVVTVSKDVDCYDLEELGNEESGNDLQNVQK